MHSLQVIHKVFKPTTPLGVDGSLRLNKRLILFYRAAIDVVLAEQVARPKVCVCLWLIKNHNNHVNPV
jgi:hypothetical protein